MLFCTHIIISCTTFCSDKKKVEEKEKDALDEKKEKEKKQKKKKKEKKNKISDKIKLSKSTEVPYIHFCLIIGQKAKGHKSNFLTIYARKGGGILIFKKLHIPLILIQLRKLKLKFTKE